MYWGRFKAAGTILGAEGMELEEHLRINRWHGPLAYNGPGLNTCRRGFGGNPYFRAQKLEMIRERALLGFL